jgi:hypothetical protein
MKTAIGTAFYAEKEFTEGEDVLAHFHEILSQQILEEHDTREIHVAWNQPLYRPFPSWENY